MSTKQTQILTTCSLYNFIYKSLLSRFAVFLLLAVICIQPFAPLFAEAFEEVSVENESPSDFIELPAVQSLAETPPADVSNIETIADNSLITSEEDTPGSDIESDSTSFEAITEPEVVSNDNDENTESDIVDVMSDNQALQIEQEEPEDSIGEQPATTTETEYPVYNISSGDATFYQFSRTSCVPVGDGSFYCSEIESPTTVTSDDRFFAAPDSSGDLEIFASLAGEYVQITDNKYDDASPYYDSISNTLVWHRLIEDRYQIVSYDVKSGKEKVLTNDSVNNMEPTRFGDIIVWQRWVGDNWEIMLYDGERVTQLTSNIYNDVAPSIRGEYVLWRTLISNEQVVTVYDLVSQSSTIIEGEDASNSLSNPRMVLVYDSVTSSGDVVTKGYDPKTGKLVPLTSLPTESPKEIPKSEQTGETRALLQNKLLQTGKEIAESTGDEPGLDTVPVTTEPAVKTMELDLSASSTATYLPNESSFTLTVASTSVSELSTYDQNTLVIPPFQGTSSDELIKTDVVIPPTN